MEYIFTFESTNLAIKAEQLLMGAGVNVCVQPVPAAVKSGCGIALRVAEREFKEGCTVIQQCNPKGYKKIINEGKVSFIEVSIEKF